MDATKNNCDRDAADLSEAVMRHQRDWAALRGVEVDDADLTADLDSNLFAPLSQRTHAEIEESRPSLLGSEEKTGEMSLLHSTAALVHNVFDYWRGRIATPIERACGAAPSADALELHFAASAASAGGAADASAADVVLATGAHPTVVAASFLEPYAYVDNQPGGSLADPSDEAGWSGLQACRSLALDLRSDARRFRHLGVARLLGLGQTWTREAGERGFRLLYLWYDGGGPAAARIRGEIDRFRMRAGGEIHFVARSWQELFRDLRGSQSSRADGDDHAMYLQYLSSRYFPVDGPA